MIIKRILATFIVTVISIPVWTKILFWIVIPSNYESDGGSDFGYGFIIFIILLPIITLVTIIITWIFSENLLNSFYRIMNQKKNSNEIKELNIEK